MDGYWIWCGSVVPGEDGRYHMFASRWLNENPQSMMTHWIFNCEIVRAASDTPEGPYQFEEVVIGRRERRFFDGLNAHNPSIKKWGHTYYLYYMGTSYPEPVPAPGDSVSPERWYATWKRKRIGLATSKSIYGPWKRHDTPLLEPRPDKWDGTITSNPSAAILEDGRTYLVYKSSADFQGSTLQLGVAFAPTPDGPYTRLSDDPIFQFPNPDFHVEDPYVWHADGRFHVIMKDDYKNDCGGVTGEWGAGIYATSEDAIHWEIADPPKAYSRTVRWTDGTTTTFANLERPNLLIQDGVPTHLFCAVGEGPKAWAFETTRNICIPLRH